MDDTMKVEKADIEDIDSLVELRLDYLIEDNCELKSMVEFYKKDLVPKYDIPEL